MFIDPPGSWLAVGKQKTKNFFAFDYNGCILLWFYVISRSELAIDNFSLLYSEYALAWNTLSIILNQIIGEPELFSAYVISRK